MLIIQYSSSSAESSWTVPVTPLGDGGAIPRLSPATRVSYYRNEAPIISIPSTHDQPTKSIPRYYIIPPGDTQRNQPTNPASPVIEQPSTTHIFPMLFLRRVYKPTSPLFNHPLLASSSRPLSTFSYHNFGHHNQHHRRHYHPNMSTSTEAESIFTDEDSARILDFWFKDIPDYPSMEAAAKRWFQADAAFDDACRFLLPPSFPPSTTPPC